MKALKPTWFWLVFLSLNLCLLLLPPVAVKNNWMSGLVVPGRTVFLLLICQSIGSVAVPSDLARNSRNILGKPEAIFRFGLVIALMSTNFLASKFFVSKIGLALHIYPTSRCALYCTIWGTRINRIFASWRSNRLVAFDDLLPILCVWHSAYWGGIEPIRSSFSRWQLKIFLVCRYWMPSSRVCASGAELAAQFFCLISFDGF